MGSPLCQSGRGAHDEDEVEVRLTHDFEIQQYEVSQTEWTALGLPNPSVLEPLDGGYADCAEGGCPVGNVTWWAALAFANRLSEAHSPPLAACYQLEGCQGKLGEPEFTCATATETGDLYACEGYRLPTEAEWEYAARAGTRTPFYLGTFEAERLPGECEARGWQPPSDVTRTERWRANRFGVCDSLPVRAETERAGLSIVSRCGRALPAPGIAFGSA